MSGLVGAEELRLPLVGGDGARRRDDVGARRGASANRLMGAVVRRLQDEAEEERVEEDGASVGEGGGVMPVAGGGDRADRIEAKRVSASGRGRRAPQGPVRQVARGGRSSQQERAEDGEAAGSATQGQPAAGPASAWEASSVDVGQAPPVTAPPTRVVPVSPRDKLVLDRPVAAERVGRTSGMARLSWGAVLAAVVGLIVLVLIGGFETPGTEGAQGAGGGTAPGDAQGRSAETPPGETSR